MKFVHKNLKQELIWDEQHLIWELAIEHVAFYRSLIQSLLTLSLEEPEFSFIDGPRVLACGDSIYVIENPWHLDFSNKKATTALLKRIAQDAGNEEFFMKTEQLKSELLRHFYEIIESRNFGFEVEIGDFSSDSLAKASGLKIIAEEADFTQSIIDYMVMMSELLGVKCFVFVALRSVLSEEEMDNFIRAVGNHQMKILLIEGLDRGKTLGISRVILDKDLCEL